MRPWFETIFDERYPELFAPLEGEAPFDVILVTAAPPAVRGSHGSLSTCSFKKCTEQLRQGS